MALEVFFMLPTEVGTFGKWLATSKSQECQCED